MKIAEDIIDSPKSRYVKLFYRKSFDKNEPIKRLNLKFDPWAVLFSANFKLVLSCSWNLVLRVFTDFGKVKIQK